MAFMTALLLGPEIFRDQRPRPALRLASIPYPLE
jgi:hypothetical protein